MKRSEIDNTTTWRRVARIIWVAVVGCALSLGVAAAARAQASSIKSTSLKGFQLVQRVDDVLYGVDAVSLEILDERHVRGSFVRVSVERPSPILGYTRFVADCRSPARISIVSSSNLNGKTHPNGSPQYIEARAAALPVASMKYSEGDLMDGTQLVAEFACRTTTQPGAAARIAQELFGRGGPPDQKTLACDLRPDGGNKTVPGVEVRYSESEGAVAVDNQWLASGAVSKRIVQFGGGHDKWVIDRRLLRARLTDPAGNVKFTGACKAL